MNSESAGDGPEITFPPAFYPLSGIGAGFFIQRLVPLPVGTHTVFETSSWLSFGISILLITWSLLTLKKFHTTAMPHLAAQQLITTGPYRFSRNPVYLAFLLLVLASALATGNVWIVLTLPIIMLLLIKRAIEPEEAHLRDRFGAQYELYKQKVRRWL